MKFCDFLCSQIDPDVSLSQSLQMKVSGQSGVTGPLAAFAVRGRLLEMQSASVLMGLFRIIITQCQSEKEAVLKNNFWNLVF